MQKHSAGPNLSPQGQHLTGGVMQRAGLRGPASGQLQSLDSTLVHREGLRGQEAFGSGSEDELPDGLPALG